MAADGDRCERETARGRLRRQHGPTPAIHPALGGQAARAAERRRECLEVLAARDRYRSAPERRGAVPVVPPLAPAVRRTADGQGARVDAYGHAGERDVAGERGAGGVREPGRRGDQPETLPGSLHPDIAERRDPIDGLDRRSADEGGPDRVRERQRDRWLRAVHRVAHETTELIRQLLTVACSDDVAVRMPADVPGRKVRRREE